MTTYKLTGENYVIKDGIMNVPTLDAPGGGAHPETLAYRAWLAAGGVPEPAEPAEPAPIKMSSLAFLDLFTESEQLAVASAAMSNVQAKLWYDRTLAAEFITIADSRTESGLNTLISLGFITESRKTEIIGRMFG